VEEVLHDVLVIKVGTSTQMEKQRDGAEKLDTAALARIGRQVVARQTAGKQSVIVSSGAITAGMMAVGLKQRPGGETGMRELQRLASIGWRHNLNAWAQALTGLVTGGMLLTRHDLDLSSECHELLEVTRAMLSHGDVPIVNENDVIAHEEIAFGDNDTLAATLVARLASSGWFNRVGLILLSDVHGLYADRNDASSLIRVVSNAENYMQMAGGAGSANGTGGMQTKLAAAMIANEAGVNMWLANGRTENVVERTMAGEAGTLFRAVVGNMELVS
jgi:glutamate 5-kinase